MRRCRAQGQGVLLTRALAWLSWSDGGLVLTGILFAAVVTTTTATTVVHTPYPQPPSVPPSYPGPTYQGYHPMPPQPGMPAAPYPTQYPPPYPAQPMGPPAYHETLAGEYHCQRQPCLAPHISCHCPLVLQSSRCTTNRYPLLFSGGAAMPYPASQPPYNPAYMDPPKAVP